MTTDQIRKNITVMGFVLIETGIYISYVNSCYSKNKVRNLNLSPNESLASLKQIGAIDEFEANPINIFWESPKGTAIQCKWEEFWTTFTFSQYEAITLVVRHEYEQYLQSDLTLLEMDKALEALK
jgi:hypothetical protein